VRAYLESDKAPKAVIQIRPGEGVRPDTPLDWSFKEQRVTRGDPEVLHLLLAVLSVNAEFEVP
jgi:hypothetical protein